MRIPMIALAIAATAAAALAPGPAASAQAVTRNAGAAYAPSEYDGAAATGLALRRLGTTARVLHIGAHPDDENTALFAPLALGRGADVAYLSLTRGEGGQNGIGPELGVPLGLIRSEELLAARRLDGGDQFFARAIDYGYSRDAAEAFRQWPRDSLVADVVAEIRRYRPDIVISVWTGTPRDGHGQHEAAGAVAIEAFLAAGDPARFPDQLDAGLRPHRAERFYWSGRYSVDGPDVALETGVLDPLLGRSYHQVAMASRSRHRSQDMGVPQAPGPRRTAFDRIDPADPPAVGTRGGFGGWDGDIPAGDLFDGIDTRLSARAAGMAAADQGADRLVALLREYEAAVARAADAFDAFEPWTILPDLQRAHALLEAAAASLPTRPRGPGAEAVRDLHFHIRAELGDLRDALLLAANVRLDVVADDELLVPGQTFDLEISLWNGGPVTVRADAGPLLPAGWTVDAEAGAGADARAAVEPGADAGALVAPPGERVARTFTVRVPADAPPTMPYFLDPDAPAPPFELYRWPDDPEIRGLPFGPDPVRGSFLVRIGDDDALIHAERDAARVGVDRRSGEFRRPVRVVPTVAVTLEPAVAVLPRGRAEPLPFTVRLRAEAPGGIDGRLRLELPPGWSAAPAAVTVSFERPGQERAVEFAVTAPADVEPGAASIRAVFAAGGRDHDLGYTRIDYPHIAPHHQYARARSTIRAVDVRVADVRVGYVPGAGDGVPALLDQLGVAWESLEHGTLARADLDRFDVVVTGTRAYEVRPDLEGGNQRLLDWARRGGTLIIQYNKYEFPAGDFAPWPVAMARPHGRVTDPAAPVTILQPGHPVFTSPNRIGPDDWDGWVQERGLYFLESWQGPFTPLLSMNDPGQPPLTGSLLVAPLGNGTYVYTGLAFFRQLPDGVPGAYRLFANLLSLGADRDRADRDHFAPDRAGR